MTDRTPAQLRRLAAKIEAGGYAVSEGADLPQFGVPDCEPFWEARRLMERCAARVRQVADDVERRRKTKSPQ